MGEEEEEEESVEEFCTPIVTPPPRANSLFASGEIRKKKKTQLRRPWRLFPADGKLAWHVKRTEPCPPAFTFRWSRGTYKSPLRVLRLG